MKIDKWVTWLDHSIAKPKLLYPTFDDKIVGMSDEELSRARNDAKKLVIECIRRNGFRFSGEYHQYGEFGMPMFDDGSVLFCSWRHWGAIMAEAWDPDGSKGLNYMDFYMTGFANEDEPIAPKRELDFK